MKNADADQGKAAGSSFLLLDPQDNILICTAKAAANSAVLIDGQTIVLTQAIEVGHKIARCALEKGDIIRRYGFPIGTMSAPAAMGDHIHQHNLQSDYIPAHGRGGTDQKGAG